MAVNIMIQGTMSNAGKSLIAAGLCRVFAQDGYREAPFKSQNMALNSYVTEEGLEMGRAQAVQAEACGIRPSVRMNPILLKPTTDMGSQVIVNGKVRANMKAADYFRHKKDLIPEIMAAYRSLEEEYDIIVLEGAGSPAEINLKKDDIVNMGMAQLADAPVLLVGDIDRGGVFAQLAGTVMLLEEEERARIRGLIINKFRGDLSILEPGLRMIEEICHRPVLGVVPYEKLDIDDEDSLSERLISGVSGTSETYRDSCRTGVRCGEKIRESVRGGLDIAVVRLPRISNFTDFSALETAEGVRVRYGDTPAELSGADMIILPGTKSTANDLAWLRRSGLAEEIVRQARAGTVIFGICGGYQMLGSTVKDPYGVEAEFTGKEMPAPLGLLPVDTCFQEQKTLGRSEGTVGTMDGIFRGLSGTDVRGYEIHMGTSVITRGREQECLPFLKITGKDTAENGACRNAFQDGCVCGNVIGTYFHGIFDNREFTGKLLGALAQRKGLDGQSFHMPDRETYRQQQYDRLAALIRRSLDMQRIYRILGLEPKEPE